MARTKLRSEQIGSGEIIVDNLGAKAVTGTKIDDNAIDSQHYVDGSIDAAHLATDSVTTDKIAALQVTGAKIADGAVDTTQLADAAITLAKMDANSVDSDQYVDGSIDAAHLANDSVTTDKIADLNVTTAKLAADAVDGTKLADDAVDSEHITDGSVDPAHLALSVTKSATTINSFLLNFDSPMQFPIKERRAGSETAPAAPAAGDRYILTSVASLDAGYGTINTMKSTSESVTLADGDVIEYDGSNWVCALDVSAMGAGALAWDLENSIFVQYDGSQWEEQEAEVAEGAAGDGLGYTAGVLNVNVDDSTIETSADTLQLKDNGTTAAKLEDLSESQFFGGNSSNATAKLEFEQDAFSPDGSTLAFTLTAAPIANTIQVFMNGMLMEAGASADYTLSGTTLTFNYYPEASDPINVHYIKAVA